MYFITNKTNKFLCFIISTFFLTFHSVAHSQTPCPSDISLTQSNNITSGTNSIRADSSYGTIIASNIIANSGTRATYQAHTILLNPGFKANSGTIFEAETGGCSNINHLALVSVTQAFADFDANTWERQYRVKATNDFQLYEVCIWGNITNPRVSLYKFDSTFNPLRNDVILGGPTWVNYRESYNILTVYTPVLSSTGYLNAFKQIFDKIISSKKANHYGIKYNGHGTSGTSLFEYRISGGDCQALLAYVKSLIGKNIDFLDWSTNCNGGTFDAVASQYLYTDYILASDELRGGYNYNINDYFNLRSDQIIDHFFKPAVSIRQSLIDMINSDRLFWETMTTRNDMIQNSIKQSISIYDTSKFAILAASTHLQPGVYYGDILTYIKAIYPAQEPKFYDFRFHYISNKDFFTWNVNSNGFIMY